MNLQALITARVFGRRSLRTTLRRFWSWWSHEILQVVPARFRDALDQQERVLFVSVQESDLVLEYRHGPDRKPVDRISLLGEPDSGEASQSEAPETDQVIVELSATHAARRQVSLPVGTEDRMADVLGYEMDRLTPYANGDVYFDYQIAARDADRKTVRVELVLALRKTIDDMLARLARRGIRPSSVAVAGTAASLNLLPPGLRVSAARSSGILPGLLTGLAVGLAVVALAYPLVTQRVEMARLEAEIAELRPAALAADEIREEVSAAKQRSAFIADRWKRSPARIAVINEMASAIPDDTWLSRIQINDNIVRIHGESENASALIGLLEASEIFEGAHFSSPVTKNPKTSNDRFVIEATVGGGGNR